MYYVARCRILLNLTNQILFAFSVPSLDYEPTKNGAPRSELERLHFPFIFNCWVSCWQRGKGCLNNKLLPASYLHAGIAQLPTAAHIHVVAS